MNPNGYSGQTLGQFQDAGPFLEGCDISQCTAPVGGEHAPTCAVSQRRCYLCRRDLSDFPYVRVGAALHVEDVCDICWEKRDEDGIDIQLDYTEDQGDA